ncbi:hypothetical protein HK096_005767, partial [Nowakowskiella sp. JEL0078]
HINNVGAIILALFPPPTTPFDPVIQSVQNLHVSILSFANFLSRLLSGLLSDLLATRFLIPRIHFTFLAALLMIVACIFGAWWVKNVSDLMWVTVLVGCSYGVAWTAAPVLVGEYFGSRRFAFHWGVMTIVPAVGGQLMSLYFGLVYDANRIVPDEFWDVIGGSSVKPCRGTKCFAPVYAFGAALSGL